MTTKPLLRLTLTALLLAGMWSTLDLATRPASGAGPPDASAQRAVRALVLEPGDSAAGMLPAGFATAEGYRPLVVDGTLLDPRGGCSSPVRLPAEFTPVCRRHDLGYDLLRDAARDGGVLPASARRAVDSQLDVGMHAACLDRRGVRRGTCEGWATVAAAAVRVNSVRQHWSVPGHETPLTVATATAGVAAVLAGAAALGLAILLGLAALRRALASVRRAALS